MILVSRTSQYDSISAEGGGLKSCRLMYVFLPPLLPLLSHLLFYSPKACVLISRPYLFPFLQVDTLTMN